MHVTSSFIFRLPWTTGITSRNYSNCLVASSLNELMSEVTKHIYLMLASSSCSIFSQEYRLWMAVKWLPSDPEKPSVGSEWQNCRQKVPIPISVVRLQ